MKAQADALRTPRASLAEVGLRWRLAGYVAALTLICLGIAFVAVYQRTGADVRGEIDSEISGEATEFNHTLALSGARSNSQLAQAAARYVRAQPFSESSTFLFAVIPGEPTPTNSPDLFRGSAPDDGEDAGEQARENRLSARLLTEHDGYSTLPVPDLGSLRVYKRRVEIGEGHRRRPVVIGVGEPVAAVVRAQ